MKVATDTILIGLMMLALATPAGAQTIVTPLVSANIKTSSGFIDLDDVSTQTHIGVGASVSRLKGWLGVDGEVMWTPSAFSGGDLVESSRLVTATGRVLALVPVRFRVRPYVSFGVGIAQIKSDDVAHLFVVDSSKLVATIGTGAWTWLTPRIGIRASIDFLRTVHEVESGSFETWRPSGGVSIKF
jgi:hypothetical protein